MDLENKRRFKKIEVGPKVFDHIGVDVRIETYIRELQECLEAVPEEYRRVAEVDFDVEMRDYQFDDEFGQEEDNSDKRVYHIYYARLETDEEVLQRLEDEKNQKRILEEFYLRAANNAVKSGE